MAILIKSKILPFKILKYFLIFALKESSKFRISNALFLLDNKKKIQQE